ncbi:hypothetical protein D9M72_445440 [compost metagenome]
MQPDLSGEHVCHRTMLAEAAQMRRLLRHERLRDVGPLLQQVQPRAAERSADHHVGGGCMQQAKPVGDGFARIVDTVELVVRICQQRGAQVGADRMWPVCLDRARQHRRTEALRLAYVARQQQALDARSLRHQRHVVVAVRGRYGVVVEQPAGVGVASRSRIAGGQFGLQDITLERVFQGFA